LILHAYYRRINRILRRVRKLFEHRRVTLHHLLHRLARPHRRLERDLLRQQQRSAPIHHRVVRARPHLVQRKIRQRRGLPRLPLPQQRPKPRPRPHKFRQRLLLIMSPIHGFLSQ
jgi:hypothetical protein